MIIPLGIRREPCAAAAGLTTAPLEWSVSPGGDLIVGDVGHEGSARRLSDLLRGIPEDGSPPSTHLADAAAARAAVARGENSLLYRAYRDVLAPRAKANGLGRRGGAPTGYWFADLVIYQGGELPGSRELTRSVGHWNTAAQWEVFQCLSGRVLILSSTRDATGQLGLRYQVCRPGDVAIIPLGAWHLTAVLAGPAAVFNIYTDADTLTPGHSSRDAAQHDQLKYHSRAAAKIAVIRWGAGIALSGEPVELGTYSPIRQVSAPDWVRGMLEPEGLAAFYQRAADTELARLLRQALTHAQQPRVPFAVTTR
ncbi:MAG: hypothetical protein ACRDS0_18365 [Pseudonocardiaceae bacterium]